MCFHANVTLLMKLFTPMGTEFVREEVIDCNDSLCFWHSGKAMTSHCERTSDQEQYTSQTSTTSMAASSTRQALPEKSFLKFITA